MEQLQTWWVTALYMPIDGDSCMEIPGDCEVVKAADAQATIATLQEKLTAARKIKADYDRWLSGGVYFTTAEYEKHAEDHRQREAALQAQLKERAAELERVRGELQKAERCISEWVDRHSTYFSKLEIDFAKLHALVATLPKVEGEILEQGDLAFVRYVHVDGPLPDIPRHDLIALLKHRQGME